MKFSQVTINSAPVAADYTMGVTAGGVDYRMTNAVLAALMAANAPAGAVVQEVLLKNNTTATTTNIMPFNSTGPLNTDGAEIMNGSFTPKFSNSLLIIEANAQIYSGSVTGQNISAAVFQNSNTNASAANYMVGAQGGSSGGGNIPVTFSFLPGSTTPITFRMRGGLQVSGTTTFNGIGGSSFFSNNTWSTIKITEIKQ